MCIKSKDWNCVFLNLRDNSVHFHECSPFWVGISTTCISKSVWNCVFLKWQGTVVYVHVYIILHFPIIYRNASVLCQLECLFLHKTVIMVVFFVRMMKIPTQKGKHSNEKRVLVHVKIVSTSVCVKETSS